MQVRGLISILMTGILCVGGCLHAFAADMPADEPPSLVDSAEIPQEPAGPDTVMQAVPQQAVPAVTGASFDPEVIYQSSEATSVLSVGYTALTPDKAYYVTVTLIDPSTGLPWTVDGQPVQETAGLVPEGSDGTVEVPFEIDVSKMEGSAVLTPHVEIMQEGGLQVCTANDGMARISIVSPVLTQTFLASDARGKISNTGTSALVQTITYHGLEPGAEYRLDGNLCAGRIEMPMELDDGTTYEASEEFTPTAEDGRVVLTYKVDGSQFAGITIVPAWELYKDGALVSSLLDATLEPKIAVEGVAQTPEPSETAAPTETPTPAPTPEPSVEPEEEASDEPPEEDEDMQFTEEELAALQAQQEQQQNLIIIVLVVAFGGLGVGAFFFLRKRR